MVKISVIIPSRISTCDRIEKLKRVISSLLNQTVDKKLYEIILVDDGSDIDLKYELKDFLGRKDIRIILLWQEKRGPAAARNSGIREANGEILFFLGDDTIAESNLLEEHLKMHENHNNCAVTNLVTPPADLNEFTRYIIGDYENIKEGVEHEIDTELGFNTVCVSLNKRWLVQELFDENFKDAAFEDTELGIRLHKKGLKIVFTRKTSVCHDHIHDTRSMVKRAKNCGKAEVYLKKKHPVRNILSGDVSGFKYNLKKNTYSILFKFFKTILARKMPRRYAKVTRIYNTFLGIEEGKRLWSENHEKGKGC